MKKNILVFLVMCSIIIGIPNVLANPYSKMEKVPHNSSAEMVNCTWYAWQQAYDKMGVSLPRLDNAKNWYAKAAEEGWHVGTEAKPNSIAVWSSGTYGHVGYVVSVEGSRMTINEAGIYDIKRDFDENGNVINTTYVAYNGNGIYNGNWASTKIGGPRYEEDSSNGSKLIGFIYLDYVPDKTKTTTTSTSKVKATVMTQTSSVSSTTLTSLSTKISKLDDDTKEDNNNIEEENVGLQEDEQSDQFELKNILPYLIVISLGIFILLLILAGITK